MIAPDAERQRECAHPADVVSGTTAPRQRPDPGSVVDQSHGSNGDPMPTPARPTVPLLNRNGIHRTGHRHHLVLRHSTLRKS